MESSAAGDRATATTTPSTQGPATSSGNIGQTVPAQSPSTLPPVAIDATASFSNDVTLKVESVESIEATAKVPGEISGPAVALEINISNGTSAAIGLDSVAVTMSSSNAEPATALSTDPAKPFAGVLDPGESASGKYVFTLPKDRRDKVLVTVQYASDTGIVQLTGSV